MLTNSHPIKVKCAPSVRCSDYINLAPAKNPTTPPVPSCNLNKVKCKNGTFAGRFKFPTLLLSNAESLNFEKLNELDSFSKIYRSDIIAITEVHAQNTHMLKMNNFTQFIKLRPETHSLGKKGSGILFFARNDFYPLEILVPCLTPFNEYVFTTLLGRERLKKLILLKNCMAVRTMYYLNTQMLEFSS